MPKLTSLLTLFFSICTPLSAQSLDPSLLSTPEAHVAFFDTIYDLHQELARRSGPVILAHGWKSVEHLALRDSTRQRNAHLREVVGQYLDLYGFPVPSADLLARRKLAQAELMKQMERINMRDTTTQDSIIKIVIESYGKDIALSDNWPTVMLILDTEPDFSKRCENISWLRFEWEEGNLSTQSFLAYLRHTYAAKHGRELDIATGSTERERIFMHARELSGCWGS